MQAPNKTMPRFHGRNIFRPGLVLALVCMALAPDLIAQRVAIELPNGDYFEGELRSGLRTGPGRYLWADGSEYVGTFLNGKMHGSGTYTFADGRVYQGGFVNDQRHGQGTMRFRDNVYEGAFHNGEMTGWGRLVYANQDVYEGTFLAGVPSGEGTYLSAAPGRGHDPTPALAPGRGDEDALPSGSGPNGNGMQAQSWGEIYRGTFLDGKKHGRGEHQLPGGNRYIGEYRNDLRHGQGTLFWRDGTVFRGFFSRDVIDGHGVKELPDGGRWMEHWRQGELLLSRPIREQPRCRAVIDEQPWMFDGTDCVNGLAHGSGIAVRLDGTAFIADARFVLGNLVSGAVQNLVGQP